MDAGISLIDNNGVGNAQNSLAVLYPLAPSIPLVSVNVCIQA